MIPPLDRLGVDPVILSMGADEPDINHPVGVVDPDYQTILVSRQIKHHSAIFENTGRGEVTPEVGRCSPICLQSVIVSGERRLFSVLVFRMILPKSLQGRQGDHSHN